MRELTIGSNDAAQRLDRFLSKAFPGASGSFLQKMIRQKKIKVNHARAQADQILRMGDRVQLYIYEEVLLPLERQIASTKSTRALRYIYQNDQLAIIDKPAGVLVHPASRADYGHTIVDAFVQDLILAGEYVPRREKSFTPALVNRLDANTSGLLIGAKTHDALMGLPKALQDGSVIKSYLAIVEGKWDGPGEIHTPLKTVNGHSFADPEGKESYTEVKARWTSQRVSLLEVTLHTGRTHQIRAHLSSEGFPLVGDYAYGARMKDSRIHHHQLLSYRLRFKDGGMFGLDDGQEFYSRQTNPFIHLAEMLRQVGGSDEYKNSSR